MNVDLTQFCVNVLINLQKHQNKFKNKFKNIKPLTFYGLTYHGVLRFIDDICTFNKHIEF